MNHWLVVVSPRFKPGRAGDAYPLRIRLSTEGYRTVAYADVQTRLPWYRDDGSFNLSHLMAWTVSSAMRLTGEESDQMTRVVTAPS